MAKKKPTKDKKKQKKKLGIQMSRRTPYLT